MMGRLMAVGLVTAGLLALLATGILRTQTMTTAEQTMTSAQVVSEPLQLPDGPAKPGFDIRRMMRSAYGNFEPFYVTSTEPLRVALADGRVAGDTLLLVTETAGGRVALLADQMAYHHVAQGRSGGKDWMATF